MKNYSEISDKKINVGVAFHLGLSTVILAENGQFDPCNNPSDAWPIVIENEIALNPRCANGEWKAQIHLGKDDIFDNYASCWDKNPLRAAMIVFLMMKDAE